MKITDILRKMIEFLIFSLELFETFVDLKFVFILLFNYNFQLKWLFFANISESNFRGV